MGEIHLPKKKMDVLALHIISFWRDLVISKSLNSSRDCGLMCLLWLEVTSNRSCFIWYLPPPQPQYGTFEIFFSDILCPFLETIIRSDFSFSFPHQYSVRLCQIVFLCLWFKILPFKLEEMLLCRSSSISGFGY